MKTLVSLLFIIFLFACNSRQEKAEEKSIQDAKHLANQAKTINSLTTELSNCKAENKFLKMQIDSLKK